MLNCLSLCMVVLVVGIAMKNYGFQNFFALLQTTLQQALAETTNLDALVLL